jgi:putative ABC transport system ATP-binding protein
MINSYQSNIVLEAVNLTRRYRERDGRELTVLDGVGFSVAAGETVAILGPSGSGKSTLLGLCAGLDQPSDGSVQVMGHPLEAMDEDTRAALRCRSMGFVFQNFQLLPTLTVLENVMVPLELRGETEAAPRARDLLARVGLGERLDHYPLELSGGEQQRVALARAFIHRPPLLFADEPTGNLDHETSQTVMRLLFELNEAGQTTLVLVTHDPELARRTQRRLHLRAGRLEHDER